MSAPESNSVIVEFFESWSKSLAHALAAAGAAAPKIDVLDAKTSTDTVSASAAKKFKAGFAAGGRLRGTLSLLTSEPEALQLAQVAKSEAIDRTAEFNDARRAAAAEFIGKVVAQVAVLWEPRAGGKVELAPGNAEGAETEAIRGGLRISGTNFQDVTIALSLSADFADSLKSPSEASPLGDLDVPDIDPGPAANLDLLFDVQLEATIRFGERQLLLREVLSLAPGAVIELDRQINEPAELLVAGRLVARGEVVVVDGSFALRVTELTNPAQRAELLHS